MTLVLNKVVLMILLVLLLILLGITGVYGGYLLLLGQTGIPTVSGLSDSSRLFLGLLVVLVLGILPVIAALQIIWKHKKKHLQVLKYQLYPPRLSGPFSITWKITMKTLILFYSSSGNNKMLARYPQNRPGADLHEIVERKPRTGFAILVDVRFRPAPFPAFTTLLPAGS